MNEELLNIQPAPSKKEEIMKRIQILAGLVLCLCMLLPLAAGTASGVEALSPPPVYGDVDGNGKVDIFDIVEIRDVIFGVIKPTASVTVTATPTPSSPTTDNCSPPLPTNSPTETPPLPTNSPETPTSTPSQTATPVEDQELEYRVLEWASSFVWNTPSVTLIKSAQDLDNLYAEYVHPWYQKPEVNPKYDDAYFEQNHILAATTIGDPLGSPWTNIDKIVFENNRLIIYFTMHAFMSHSNQCEITLIEVDRQKFENVHGIPMVKAGKYDIPNFQVDEDYWIFW